MNFCASCLEPSITVNKPEADGREVTNLISPDPSLQKNGYMGEYFIRTPVDITVTFKVPIDVSHMKLNNRLARRCSTAFMVFTDPEKTGPGKDQLSVSKGSSSMGSYTCELPNVKHSGVHTTGATPGPSTSSVNSEDSTDVYFCVGKFYTQDEDMVVLKNHHYRHWINIKMPEDDTRSIGLRVYKGALRHTNRLALRSVKRIIVRILRTDASEPPVLQTLEIWGQPGISTVKSHRKEIISQWHRRVRTKDAITLVPRIYNSMPEEKQEIVAGDAADSKDLFEIPEDFLDPLTCDVMTVPLLLPSGHSIDADTLDKYIANEAIWGRSASDPFTGVPFKPGQMPSPNVPLKARIDRFILLNADHPQIQVCGRTLATTSGSQFRRGLNMCNLISNGYWQHTNDNVSKRKFDSTRDVAKMTVVDGACEATSNSVDNESSRTKVTRVDDGNAASCSAAVTGLAKMNTGQLRNVGNAEHEKNHRSDSLSNSTLKKDTDIKSCRKSSHLQIPRPARNQQRKPHQHLVTKKPATGSHHGLVHMIGSAISSTQQRGAEASKSQGKRSLGKPSSLIQGDAKPASVNALDLASKNSAACHCGEKNDLYNLPCNHVICRMCLFLQKGNAEVICTVCGHQCARSGVVKYHKRSIFSMD